MGIRPNMIKVKKFKAYWQRFWMRYADQSPGGRVAARLAAWFAPPYYGRVSLARLDPKGYISPQATVHHTAFRLGQHCCIGEGVLIYQDREGGPVRLGDAVHLHRDTIVQTGRGGTVTIGSDTHIQPRCQISAYAGSVTLGQRVEIAPNCAFYPYDHGTLAGVSVREQPLRTKGGIVIEDDVWLGFGVIVLDGVRIGKGAIVGAGSVVSRDIPDDAIAVGVPARVRRLRSELRDNNQIEIAEYSP